MSDNRNSQTTPLSSQERGRGIGLHLGAALLALLFAACSDDGGGASPEPDAGADAGADGGAGEECTDGVWVDPFDEAECPDMSGWDDCVVHVRTDGSPGGDGRTWATATNDLQDAVNTARCGAIGTELCAQWQVWIAEGTYYVFEECNSNTIWLRSDVALYGGFAGDETELEQRDPAANETILSGADGPGGARRVMTVLIAYGTDGVTLDRVTITEGESDDNFGGGLWAYDAEMGIRDCAFRDNRAWIGGGIYSMESSVAVSGSDFSGNAASQGAGIEARQSNLSLDTCAFTGNVVDGQYAIGGALSCWGSSIVSIADSAFTGNTARYGGAVKSYQASVEISGSEFTGNTAAFGGAILSNFDSFTISSSSFVGNEAEVGGAAYLADGLVDIADSFFEDNLAVSGAGGQGGALFVISPEPGSISSCSFSANEAESLGGALLAAFGALSVTDCSFTGNAASPANGAGGGVFIQEIDEFEMTGCEVIGNSAKQGGGINFAINPGGVVSNTVLARNTAVLGGGVFGDYTGSPPFRGCTFYGNVASAAGGAACAWNGAFEASDSVFWGDAPDEIAWIDLDAPPTVTYSDVQGGYPGAGNIDADPLFADAAGDDFHLTAGSPCIDAANGDLAPELDFDGNPRVDDPEVDNTGVGTPDFADMGAFEFQPE